MEELDAYLKESQEGRKKDDGLREMHSKNHVVFKEYMKLLEDIIVITNDSFESAF